MSDNLTVERVELQKKDKSELQTIVIALGGKPASRATKADLIESVLQLSGVVGESKDSSADAEVPAATPAPDDPAEASVADAAPAGDGAAEVEPSAKPDGSSTGAPATKAGGAEGGASGVLHKFL